MAYFISNGIVEATPLAIELVDATFEELLKMFEYEDEGFTTLEDFWGFG
jgi:hypothetical protein